MSLRARVVLIVMALAGLAALAGFAAVVVNARAAALAETTAALDAAEFAVTAELARPDAVPDAAALVDILSAQDLRHLTAHVPGHDGPIRGTTPEARAAPGWFAALVWQGGARREIPFAGAAVVLEADPRDELAEAWSDAMSLAGIAAVALLLLLVAVHGAVTRALAPLAGFRQALEALARGEEGVAPGVAPVGELRTLGDTIRALDDALARSRRENRALSRAVLELQDRERQELARDLHDELGPLLFGIRVDAHALAKGGGPEVAARAHAIADAAGEIRDLSRRILGRLRPMALDHLDLGEVLQDLVEGLRGQEPGVAITLDLAPNLAGLGEAVDITVYRVVQEGVLNALRHGNARQVAVSVARVGPDRLSVEVRDDGRGLAPDSAPGHGILGMRERVRALGGELSLGPGNGGGTRVIALLPLSVRETSPSPHRGEAG